MRRSVCALVSIVATLVLPSASEATERCLGLSHVRAVDRSSARLVEEGYKRSPTLQRLLHALESNKIIVYIEQRPLKAQGVGGFLALVENPALPFVRIVLDRQMASDPLLGLLGHELQHALEIAQGNVKTSRELERLYDAIGSDGVVKHSYDSLAARRMGEAVMRDLLNHADLARAAGDPEPARTRS